MEERLTGGLSAQKRKLFVLERHEIIPTLRRAIIGKRMLGNFLFPERTLES